MRNIIKPLCLLTGLLCTPAVWLHAQVDEKLKADIVSTGYVHSPLPLDETKAFETFGLKKKVLETVMLCDMEDFSKWSHKGIGKQVRQVQPAPGSARPSGKDSRLGVGTRYLHGLL